MNHRRTLLAVIGLAGCAALYLAWDAGTDSRQAGEGVQEPKPADATDTVGTPISGDGAEAELAVVESELAGEVMGETDALTVREPTPRFAEAPPEPGTRFEPSAFDLTTIEIFRGFWRDALAWTAEDFYRESDRVEGLDGRETYQVYVYLRTCLDQPRNQQDFDRLLRRIERSRRRNEDRLQRLIDDRTEGLIRCEGLDEEDLPLLAYQWLDLAAERGYPQAQVAYYRSARWLLGRSRDSVFRYPDLVLEYRDRAPAYLASALASGHPDALLEYADALRDGIIFPADAAQAYAYAVAADLAAHGAHLEARETLEELAEFLEPGEMDDARERGRELCKRFCRIEG